MSLLKNIRSLTEEKDESGLTELQMKDIRSNISKGAKDLEQEWANALELVHRAYLVSQVPRPTPATKTAWKQYEENLQYAVQQLAKTRGMDADWRMSAASLHEQMESLLSFKVTATLPDGKTLSTEVQADDLDTVVSHIKRYIKKDPSMKPFTIKVEDTFKGKKLTFWANGQIRKNASVLIEPE